MITFFLTIIFVVILFKYNIYISAIITGFLNLFIFVFLKIIKKNNKLILIINFFLLTSTGLLSLYLKNDFIIKLKPTLFYWLASIIIFTLIIKKKFLKENFKKINEKYANFIKINFAILFFIIGLLNIYIAKNYKTKVWLIFKILIFPVIIFIYITVILLNKNK